MSIDPDHLIAEILAARIVRRLEEVRPAFAPLSPMVREAAIEVLEVVMRNPTNVLKALDEWEDLERILRGGPPR